MYTFHSMLLKVENHTWVITTIMMKISQFPVINRLTRLLFNLYNKESILMKVNLLLLKFFFITLCFDFLQIKEELLRISQEDNTEIMKTLMLLGQTFEGRDLLALKVTEWFFTQFLRNFLAT